MKYHLAQVNVARMKAPLDDPAMAEFTRALDEINALADKSPGFIWRFQTDAGNATGFRAYEDPLILFNVSVWESVQALKDYVYKSMHGRFFARREEWFSKLDQPHMALWWIPVGTIPDVIEAKERLEHLRKHGPGAHCFTFQNLHEPAV